eukprot:SAG22_NODE_849_length_6858_cov_1.246190_7_plen_69_part_00
MMKKALYIACAISILLEFFVKRKSHFGEGALDAYFGFYAITGFVACILCIALATLLGRLVKRKESYYD